MKRLISIVVSLLILAVIYWKIDLRGLVQVFQNCDRTWMLISLGMVVPITLITAWRLQQLMPKGKRGEKTSLGFAEATRLILVASVLNMVLPSKMGDIAKAYFMRERGHLSGSLSLSLVIFEKACDMLSLLLWCAFGLLLYPQKDWLFWIMTVSVVAGLVLGGALLGSRAFAQFFFDLAQTVAPKKLRTKLYSLQTSWREMHEYFWGDRQQFLKVTATSIFIWFLHLLQIWFFILALNAWTPFLANLALSPLAILAGLLPLTFAGVGTRDAALILFYQPYFSAQIAAALGVLCTSRYVLPAIGGLPFLSQYMATVRSLRK
ncbi:flippase-like domain-containing protein [Leptolyngbya sp. FACHB-36]|uniref:lysylphosphatidylglycerol synthase transmembrane domain-containing protein n=1 Tax=Leptolyngbya sp. FACHB-36 TaxID=2692808 RepID=UPI0016806CCB|nr:lysylphosphatidylglycerol synthase transmembrane domain-containing protein [Leptolyngbya sp. FACHB-36]MBD2018582.1 flippase-like domain-containing protein [Leptolyngbya sp. FACHB-36]